MTKEIELLLIDLSGRLPYEPLIYVDEKLPRLKIGASTRIWEYVGVTNPCKPYLRKMSSMTEEERKEYHRTFFYHERYDNEHKTGQNCSITFETYDWLNKHHFAYRTINGKDMFELGLALEAPKDMYKFE